MKLLNHQTVEYGVLKTYLKCYRCSPVERLNSIVVIQVHCYL